jgi:chorismate synthase
MLRYLTGGESHGKCMLTILDGMPAGLAVDSKMVDRELSRRQAGYGRGGRMKIESDRVRILSGLRKGRTIGGPIAMEIANADHSIDRLAPVLNARPGHADLTGALKYGLKDMRSVLERASARDTVSRVACGAVAKMLLAEFGIRVLSHVTSIGDVEAATNGLSFGKILALAERSPVRCADPKAAKLMCEAIDAAAAAGDTLGGVFEVIVEGAPAGLGSYTQWDRRIDGELAKAVISIQAVKAVGFGLGFKAAALEGSCVHDGIFYDRKNLFHRRTNNAGGIEGGMTNGEDIIIRAAMKPISTLMNPLPSVNIKTKKAARAAVERSDICAAPAAGVVGEAVCAIVIADAMTGKFGADSLEEMRRNYDGYMRAIRRF